VIAVLLLIASASTSTAAAERKPFDAGPRKTYAPERKPFFVEPPPDKLRYQLYVRELRRERWDHDRKLRATFGYRLLLGGTNDLHTDRRNVFFMGAFGGTYALPD
jgi:hypothetical protein